MQASAWGVVKPGFRLRILFYIGLSVALHACIIGSVKPYAAKPFRSIGLTARLAVANPAGNGKLLATPTPQNRKAAMAAAQTKESVPARQPRRAILIPDFEFSQQTELGSPTVANAGSLDWALATLNLPQVPDRYFSAGEVDIRAEPIIDLIPPGMEQSETSSIPGRLKLRLLIDEFGKVTSLEVLESFPPGFLEDSALPYIRELIFKPARINSLAVKSEKIIEIAYSPDAAP